MVVCFFFSLASEAQDVGVGDFTHRTLAFFFVFFATLFPCHARSMEQLRLTLLAHVPDGEEVDDSVFAQEKAFALDAAQKKKSMKIQNTKLQIR